jgi:hypothetical protein
MCKKIYVESPVTQTQRVAVLDSNHLKKKIVRPKYESTNFEFTNRAVVWTGATKIFVRCTHPVTASRGQGNLVRDCSFFRTSTNVLVVLVD